MSCCGANPGMVSWFVKKALLDVARDLGLAAAEPQTRDDWARLMQRVGVKGIPDQLGECIDGAGLQTALDEIATDFQTHASHARKYGSHPSAPIGREPSHSGSDVGLNQ